MTEPTHTDVDVERVARAIAYACEDVDKYERAKSPDEKWEHMTDSMKEWWLAKARAAIAALPQREVSAQEAARVLLDEHEKCRLIHPTRRTERQYITAHLGRNRLRALAGDKP